MSTDDKMLKERSFGAVLLSAIKILIVKIVSLKNLIALLSIALGMILAKTAGMDSLLFKEWARYMFGVLVLFFASNQVQKWIFSRSDKEDNRYEPIYGDKEDEDGPES